MTKPRVLLVEDDERISSLLHEALTSADYEVVAAENLANGRQALQAGADIMLLDLGLPDGDGLQLCRELRESGNSTPVIVLTARGEPNERVRGLEAGADDYMAKPFHLPELIARMSAVLRRVPVAEKADVRLSCGEVWIDTITHMAGVAERRLPLKKREFQLLEFFLRNPDRAWTRLQLLEKVWGPKYACEIRAVDLNVARLRSYLEANNQPRYIHTVWGVGYRFGLES